MVKIDKYVKKAFCEALYCFNHSNFTAAALMCRKVLMNIAVAFDANEGEKFAFYIE